MNELAGTARPVWVERGASVRRMSALSPLWDKVTEHDLNQGWPIPVLEGRDPASFRFLPST